jgi:hypothetical protein
MASGPVIPDEIPQIKRNGWADNFFRPLLVTVMILSFNVSLVNLVRLVNPAWRGIYFLGGILLVTLEAIYSYRILKQRRSFEVGPLLRYRLAEWVLLIVILKLLNLAGKPPGAMWAELEALWYDPLNLINVEFYVVIILAMLAWTIATATMDDFEALYDPYSIHTRPMESLTTRFFWGGTILVLISGVSQWVARAGAASLLDYQRPSLSEILINVLVYFMAGLVLLSQANLTRLLVGWQYQKITITRSLAKQWARYGLLFLGVITLVVFFLPTSYTLGFLNSAGIIIQSLIRIIVFLVELLLFLITLPLMWLASLFESPAEMPRFVPPAAPPMATPPPAATPSLWLEALKSLAFWLLVLATVAYFVKIYFNDHPELIQWLKDFKPVKLITAFLAQLWQQLWGLARTGLEALPTRIKLFGGEEPLSPLAGGWGWFGLRGLSPRAQIVRYYLNILRRAEKQGLVRHSNQTPYEYQPDLSRATPTVEPAIKALTDAFVHARYSQQVIEKTQVASVRGYWQQIRRALRARVGRSAKSEEENGQ